MKVQKTVVNGIINIEITDLPNFPKEFWFYYSSGNNSGNVSINYVNFNILYNLQSIKCGDFYYSCSKFIIDKNDSARCIHEKITKLYEDVMNDYNDFINSNTNTYIK